ncbi:MAG: hypothetical protein FGM57_02745 [Candidatus Taylorbacteria bacterium]|nr:hypothetical protein [Candidatus Taylorbacteria bacterium]
MEEGAFLFFFEGRFILAKGKENKYSNAYYNNMNKLIVKVDKREVEIDRQSFVELIDFPPVRELKAYKDALDENRISFNDLRGLALKSDIPYPLFFAPRKVVVAQIDRKNRLIQEKIPTKEELSLVSRGSLKVEDVELIVRDLSRRQEFLKRRVLPNTVINSYVGSIAKDAKRGVSIDALASKIRNSLNIDLNYMRTLPKTKVLEYLCRQSEKENVLIAFSSHNYMPQTLDKELDFSGLCVRDKKFPTIFINRRDGDDDPKILETEGRQIFTLTSMLVCVAMNKFVLNMKDQKEQKGDYLQAFSIAAEVLIPAKDLEGMNISSLEELKDYAKDFKVTPSMFLVRLLELGLISKPDFGILFGILKKEIEDKKVNRRNHPLPVNGYGKYNGEKFSKESIRAHASGLIATNELRNALFRRGKVDSKLFNEYYIKFK